MPLVTVIIMDTHKTDAELSVLSSGGGVHHRLPDRVDDLRFIRRTIRNKQKRYPAFGLLLFQKHSYHGKTEIPMAIVQDGHTRKSETGIAN